jgi:methyl-accepting chemotaxis protein
MIESRPSGRAFVRHILLYTGGYTLLAIAVITLYLSGLLQLSADQWLDFLKLVAGVFVVIFPAMTLAHRRIFQRIQRCLDRWATGQATPEELRLGFAAISDFPRYWFVWGLGWWALGGAAVAAGMWLRHPGFGSFEASVVLAGTVSGAFITDMVYFLTIKRVLAPTRVALAAELGGPEVREALTRRLSLRSKLLTAFTSVILVTVVFSALLAEVRTRRSVESVVHGQQRQLLDAVAEHGELSFEEASSWLATLGSGSRLVLLDAAAERVMAGPRDALAPRDLHQIRAHPAPRGNSAGLDAASRFSWRPLPREAGVLAAVEPARERQGGSAYGGAFVALLVLSTLVAIGVAWLLARDVGDATALLQDQAGRVARGDLTPGGILESEDEMGALAHSFERMTASLRATLKRVSGAADRMQTAADEIASTSRSVAGVTESQVSGIAQATRSTGAIDARVREIAGAAEGLSAEVEGASGAIAELDATGGELSRSATALSSNAEEVASSIEETARSVAQVAESADALALAAEESASSVEETAEAASQVGSSAGEMARLSARVVELAEGGHQRVRETVQGMAAIDEATASAQRVIARLADSTREIDAVIGVIDEVADETALLALNAAIIAAQAGEHGRPFAVVAEEIKELADRVLSSTKEVTRVIRAVQQESEDATGAIARGAENVRRGVELTGEAGVSLDEITRAARESEQRIEEVSRAVEEQSQAVGFVAERIERVRSGAEEIRQSIREQERSTGQLRRSAGAVGEVSRKVRHTTAEQAQSTGGIRRNMESVRNAVSKIHATLRDQSEACRNAVDVLEGVHGGTRSNEESVQRLDQAMSGLLEKADELRREVALFRF